jgi:hypothetical protein
MSFGKKRGILASALLLSGALAIACGDDSDDKDTGPQTGATRDVSLTLVLITAVDDSAPIADPHKIIVLDSETGKPLDPPIETTSEAVTGKILLKGVPADKLVNLYVQGVARDPEATSTYDGVILNVPPDTGETLLRVSTQGTAALAGQVAGFTPAADKAGVTGTVYWSPGGVRKGAVGCAKIYIDGKTANADDFDQRYVYTNRLPATISTQSQTLRAGSFYFGNVPKGQHSLQISLDDGQTFINDEDIEFTVGTVRGEAASPYKSVLYQLGIDIKTEKNPTLDSCPADPMI